jgi:ABC-type antimicrobial peptide transport system permease subunit
MASDDVWPFANLSVQAEGGAPSLLVRDVAAAIRLVNRDVSLTFRAFADQVNATLIRERLIAIVSGFFGALSLLLAAIGLYGVTASSVTSRRTEIGVRMALGADARRVVRLVLVRVAVLAGAGMVLGAVLSFWASRYVSTLLYGLDPRDASTLGAAMLVLGLTAALAGWLPARRAARIDAAEVLREG